MMQHDDAFLDSVAVLALGALPEAEARDVVAHIATCADCSREYRELRSAADAVGYAAESLPGAIDELAAARMKSNVMKAVRADATPQTPAVARTSASRWPYYAAAAALVLAVLSGITSVSLRTTNEDQRRAIADEQQQIVARQLALDLAEKRARDLNRRLAEVVAPGAKHFAVANGEVIESNGKILIAFAHLPAAPSGRVYQAWTLARGAKAVAPSITFVPDATGVAVIELPESAANLAAVAVSVEPPGGSKAPTSKPTFVRALS